MNEQAKQSAQHGERLQKVLAQVGLGSRRTMEIWISAGRITVNGEVATLGMRVTEDDVVRADKRIVHFKTNSDSLPRVLLYHKQEGEIVSRDDPEKRVNVFDKLPKLQGMKWIAIGRLDYNTSGLLIFTTSGDLANRLMHPRFEVEREYAVRVQGRMTDEQMQQMVNDGITLEDGPVKFERLTDEGGEGYNHWYRLMLKEGRNRVVRRTFDALGLPISRLIRVRFGLVNLPPRLKRGELAELGTGEVNQVLDWVSMESKPVADKVTESTKSMTGKLNNRIADADHKNKKSGTGMKASPSGKGDARRSATQHKKSAPLK